APPMSPPMADVSARVSASAACSAPKSSWSRRLRCGSVIQGWRFMVRFRTRSTRRHFDDELYVIVLGFSRRQQRPEVLPLAPAQPAVRAVREQAHFIFRVAHLNLHEALEEGGLVVVEGRRHDVPRKRPGTEVFHPEPERHFPDRGL